MAVDRRIVLRDGRTLGFSEYGDPKGEPLFYMHGFPSARLEAGLTDAAARKLGIWVIAPDRPGIGLSDFKADRVIGDWPSDVAELGDALGLERFPVLGVSGGGPYALACAVKIPERLTRVGIVGGLGPIDGAETMREMSALSRLFLQLFRWAPGFGHLLFVLTALAARRSPERLFSLFTANASCPDRNILARPEVRGILVESEREALRKGPRGGGRELFLYTRPWGIDLAGITVPIHLWHGLLDATVPSAMGKAMSRAIPGCRAEFLPDEGHFSLPFNHMEEILRTVVTNHPSSPFLPT